jgi:hypothetical protein
MTRIVLAILALLVLVPAPAGAVTMIGCMDANGSSWPASTQNPCPVAMTAAPLVLVPLDVATVTTGGTAVTALAAGHRTRGGWLQNPAGATVYLCINEQGTATGTTSAGNTTCIAPGTSYQLAPNAAAVSVITSDSAHPFSGMGFN